MINGKGVKLSSSFFSDIESTSINDVSDTVLKSIIVFVRLCRRQTVFLIPSEAGNAKYGVPIIITEVRDTKLSFIFLEEIIGSSLPPDYFSSKGCFLNSFR